MAALDPMYRVPPELATEFTPKEVASLREQFKFFDESGDGNIDAGEVRSVLEQLGESKTQEEIQQMIIAVDRNNDNMVSFGEFCMMFHNSRGGAVLELGATAAKASKKFLQGSAGGHHSFSEAEKVRPQRAHVLI